MSSYGKIRGGTYQASGHVGYPNGCIYVFDPEFEEFCRAHAEKLKPLRDDPWLVGHFSDNELPFTKLDLLDRYLQLDAHDPGFRAARRWLDTRLQGRAGSETNDEDRSAFLEFVVDRYYRIVGEAIRGIDPNHLYLGSRLHGGAWKLPAVIRAAGRHLDVVTINWYWEWTPRQEVMDRWAALAGKPFMITEWYAKGMDSGMENESGAGWVVKTQADRGRFYQNFTLSLLRHPFCVGWHWFKFMDNDPTDTSADPSNLNSNKGIVTNQYRPYPALLRFMRELNLQVYPLREFLLK
jgi:hypothetical protein